MKHKMRSKIGMIRRKFKNRLQSGFQNAKTYPDQRIRSQLCIQLFTYFSTRSKHNVFTPNAEQL